MAEERTLGLVRAPESSAEDLSKEDLQRRLDQTRHSISETVTEIKESVQHQVQVVKDTLDWREQFKKRPVAWSAGAVGVGFAVGYCIAANVLDRDDHSTSEGTRSYAAQPILGAGKAEVEAEESGPGFFERVSQTPAYGRVKEEAGAVGNVLMQELSNIAKTVLVPALITSLRNFIGGHLPASAQSSAPENKKAGSGYQPILERTH